MGPEKLIGACKESGGTVALDTRYTGALDPVNAVRQVRCIDFVWSVTIPYATKQGAAAGFRRLALIPGSMGDAMVARDADYIRQVAKPRLSLRRGSGF